jgi:glycosyltransferase involved in cell wall biosynthesis
MNKILYINSNDQMGQRFSGIDWFEGLEELDFSPRMLIGRDKTSEDLRIRSYRDRTPNLLKNAIKYFERNLGHQSYLSPTYFELMPRKEFREADIVHYQVIHDGNWFRLEDLPILSKRKPSIWTWHDAWPLTGHCIQPLDCLEFTNKCSTCPHLDWPMELKRDTAHAERIRKSEVIQKTKMNIHVTSNWMKNLIEKSNNFDSLKIRVIPFGIDTRIFNTNNRIAARKNLGISDENFVIGIRASDWIVKNTPLFLRAIQGLDTKGRKVDIFVYEKLDALWQINNLSVNITVYDFGWLSDESLVESYKCLDAFLGISTGESFGFMPLEAAACGAIPISLKNTSVSEFSQKIDNYLSIENDEVALRFILENLMENESRLNFIKNRTQEVVAKEYQLDNFLVNLTDYYNEVIADHVSQ